MSNPRRHVLGSIASFVVVCVACRAGDAASVTQQSYLKASNTNTNDEFGYAAALSGDTAVIGAIAEDSAAVGVGGNQSDNSVSFSGAAYVFVRSGSSWSQQAYLKASNTGTGDRFGWSVAVSGDTVVVGARAEESNATGVDGNQNNNSASEAGAVYVFVRNGTTWTQQAYLKASNNEAGDQFGYSVAISGDTLVVGARGEASNAIGVDGDQTNDAAGGSGAAYVFVRSGTVWTQQAYLKASNTGSGDEFGAAVAISGDTIVVGARSEDSNATGVGGNQANNSAGQAGAAYVFVRNGTAWSQQAYLKASNTGGDDGFGVAVAVSGGTAVVGAYTEDSGASGVDGNGADDSVTNSGAAYVFARSGSTWSQQGYLKASNPGAADVFGDRVAISGDRIVIGAPREDGSSTGIDGPSNESAGDSGAAYLFARAGTTWSQRAYVKASNTGNGDGFGWDVAISGDSMIVSAESEGSLATGVNGNQSDDSGGSAGACYAFAIPPVAWHDLGSGISGANGIPRLDGFGDLEVDSPGALVLSSALANAPSVLVSALTATPQPLFCGTLIPTLRAQFLILAQTDAAGRVEIDWPGMPAGMSGMQFWCQWIVVDAASGCAISISNAVRGDVP